MAIILASKSPRRQELLSLMGIKFSACAADIDEKIDEHLPIEQEISRISRQKAEAIGDDENIIISADTVVVLGNTVMGKPKREEHAREMLSSLSGKTHRVITAVTVRKGDKIRTKAITTEIVFRKLSDREIDSYVESGSPMDKAGAYGIQEKAATFVEEIRGDYFSVVGLPVCTLATMLLEFGVEI